jgi:hypothetical protein
MGKACESKGKAAAGAAPAPGCMAPCAPDMLPTGAAAKPGGGEYAE